MKKLQYTRFIALLVVTMLSLHGSLVAAQETNSEGEADASAEASAEIKVDAGNALNMLRNAIGDLDSDGDGYGDVSIREGGQTVDAGTVPENQETEKEDTGNKSDKSATEPNYLDDDSDDDGIDDVAQKEIEVIEYRDGDDRGTIKVNVDASTPLLMTALSIDATTPLLYDGISISLEDDSCDTQNGGDCDDTDTERSPSARFNLNVSGDTVRGWNAQQREEVQTRATTMAAVESPEDFGIWLVDKIIENESIERVDANNNGVTLRYQTHARLFGLIPVPFSATVRHMGRMKVGDVTLERNFQDETVIDYPWYEFLVKRGAENQQEILSLVKEISTYYNASLTAETKFKAGKALADTVK